MSPTATRRLFTRRMAAALIGALLVVVSGCGSAAADRSVSEAPKGGPGVDLGFTATTVSGAGFEGARLAGKPAVLWFWAPWCPTCHAQTPVVSSLAETYAGQVNVVGVGGLDNAATIRDYASNIGEHVTVLVDAEGEVWRHFGVTAQSTFVILDRDGRVVADGYLDETQLNRHVTGLVS